MPENPTTTAPVTPRTETALVPPEAATQVGSDSPLHAVARTVGRLVGGAVRLANSTIRHVTCRSAATTGRTTDVTLPPQDTSTEAGARLHRPGEGVLPVPHYDSLSAGDAIIAVRTLEKLEQVQAVGRHEKNNKARSTVVTAVEDRVAELSARDQRT